MRQRMRFTATVVVVSGFVGLVDSHAFAGPGLGGGSGGSGGQIGGTISAYVWTSTTGGGGGDGCDWEKVEGTLAVGDNGSATWPMVRDGLTYNLWRRTCGERVDWYEVPELDPIALRDVARDRLVEAHLPPPDPVFYAVDPVNGWAYVRVPVDFRVDPAIWKPVSVTARLGPYWATATASPTELSFSPGDPGSPSAASCGGDAPIAAYNAAVPGACSYAFANASSTSPFDGYHFQTTTSISWAVSWSSSSGAGGPLPGYTTASNVLLAVAEVQGVVTCTGARPEEGDC